MGGGDAVHGSLPIIQSMCLSRGKMPTGKFSMTRLATNWTRVWAPSDGVLTEEEDLQVLQQVPRTTASMNPPSVQPKGSGASSSFMEPGTRGSKETCAVA